MPDFEFTSPEGKKYLVTGPEGATPEQAYAILQQQLGAPKKPVGLGEAIKQTWDNPPQHPSVIRFLKDTLEGFSAPTVALQGGFTPQLENPGVMTEEDAFRANAAKDQMRRAGMQAAGGIQTGAVTGGIFAAPTGSFAMGASRPPWVGGGGISGGATPRPTPPPAVPPAAPAVGRDVVATANELGIPVPRYMAEDARLQQGIAAGLQNIPGAGDKIAKAADTTQKAIGSAVSDVSQGYGAGSPAVAGSYARDSVNDWIKSGSQNTAERLYKFESDLNPTVTTPLTNTERAVAQIARRRSEAAIPGESGAVNIVSSALQRPAGMTYPGLKDLRSYLGTLTEPELIRKGIQGPEFDIIYGALSKDLRNAAYASGGPNGAIKFDRANTVYEQIADRRRALVKLVGLSGDAPAEAVFAKLAAWAGSKSSADTMRLMQARKAMGPDSWNEVASAVVSKMGRNPQDQFSIDRFLTAYGNLSQAGKDALFRTTGRDNLAKSLDDINFVASSLQDKLKQFYNPSGTAKSWAATSTVMGIIHKPIEVLGTMIGGGKLASLLSEPATARATADWYRAYYQAITAPSANSSKQARDASQKLAGIIASQTGIEQAALAAQLQAILATANPSTSTKH